MGLWRIPANPSVATCTLACLRLAQQAKTAQEKDLLLQMAETWWHLADRTERTETLWKPSPDRNAD